MGVPSPALLLELFSVKESAEGFLYISKWSSSGLIISDMPSSHKFWKERYFFVSGLNWEYNPVDPEDKLGLPTSWTTPENLREFSLSLIGFNIRKSLGVSNFGLVVWFSSARPGLSPEDEEVKRRFVRCHPQAYSELIRSNILGSSGAKPARHPILWSSPPSAMKPSLLPVSKSSSSFALEPLIAKPTKGELRARLEVLAKKKMSVKWKTQASPEGCPPTWGKILKMGVFSSASSVVGAGDSSRRAAEPPLKVLPILVWSPTSQGAEPPPPIPDDVGRGRFSAVRDEDSLLSHVEFAAGAVSSILRDSNLKKVDAMSIEEALALTLQGTTSVRPSAFADPFPYCFILLIDSFLFFGRWLLTRRAWQGEPALLRASPRR